MDLHLSRARVRPIEERISTTPSRSLWACSKEVAKRIMSSAYKRLKSLVVWPWVCGLDPGVFAYGPTSIEKAEEVVKSTTKNFCAVARSLE